MSAGAPVAPVASGRDRAPSEAWLGLVPPSSSAAALAWARRARALGPWTYVTLSVYYGPSGETIKIDASLRKIGQRPEDLELYEVRACQLLELLPDPPTIVGAGTTGEWLSFGVLLCARVTVEVIVLKSVGDRFRATRRAKSGGGS